MTHACYSEAGTEHIDQTIRALLIHEQDELVKIESRGMFFCSRCYMNMTDQATRNFIKRFILEGRAPLHQDVVIDVWNRSHTLVKSPECLNAWLVTFQTMSTEY